MSPKQRRFTDDERGADDAIGAPDEAPQAVSALLGADEELPVVARMVVEIRSDGTRTIARGALDDRASGQQVALAFDVGSPLSLAKSLARTLLSVPAMAGDRWRARLRRKALRGD